MLKNDRWIRKMSQEQDMINPFSEKQVSEGVISYGLSSYGYDLRVRTFQFVLWGGKAPNEALAAAMLECVGEA